MSSSSLRSLASRLSPAWLRHRVARSRQRALERKLPEFARTLIRADAAGVLGRDDGPHAALESGVRWLLRAQECSATRDGGVARHYSVLRGWAASYPETTGYIVPTLIEEGVTRGDERLLDSARRMLDWLVAIQFPEGGFQGGVIGEEPRVPVTFNTGQILLGLAAGARHFGDLRYRDAMRRAAEWLVSSQDADGCWRRFRTPFAVLGDKAYETHVAWGLFEADRVQPGSGYGEAGMRQVDWALGCQRPNGWFSNCCLTDDERPLTHTLGYVLRGLLEAHRWRPSTALLGACERTGRALASCLEENGRLPARLDRHWRAAADYACLTGIVQIAYCWMLLHELTGDEEFLDCSARANGYVRRTLLSGISPDVDGGVRGSYPLTGEYGRYEFLNWAAKFMIDSNRKEIALAAAHLRQA